MAAQKYILVSSGSAIASDGGTVPAGTGYGCIVYDPIHEYTPPQGTHLALESDFFGPMYVAVPPPTE